MAMSMIFVVEIMKDGTANVFRSAANFITHDNPEPMAARVFWSENEARAAHQLGADVFSNWGQAGYKSKYPICAGVIVTIPSAGEGHRNRPRSSRRT